MKRVAYVVKVFPKLSETFIANELAELKRRGVELRVISLTRPTESLRHGLIAEAGLDKLTSYDEARFAELLRGFRPDLLHAHFATEPAAAARKWGAELGLPFTVTCHGYDIRRKPPADFAERAAAARKLVTVSQANAEYIHQHFGVPIDHIRVIPCGIDTGRFVAAGKGGRGSEPPLIVCVARHVKVKNLPCLLEACGLLSQRRIAFRCVLVGDGPCRNELEELCSHLRLRDWITFAGAAEQKAVLNWWQQATVAVLTSENEGMPVCLMEAAACGLPAVATAVGGIPELVEDGVTGLLATPNDAGSVADALEKLLKDSDLAERMGRAARFRAEQRFSLSGQVDQLLELWKEILSHGNHPRSGSI